MDPWVKILILLLWLPVGALTFRLAEAVDPKTNRSKNVFWVYVYSGFVSAFFWLLVLILFGLFSLQLWVRDTLYKIGGFRQ